MKVFRAEQGDMFTSFRPGNPDSVIWCYRGDKCTDVRDFVDGSDVFAKDKQDDNETILTPAQVDAWAAANDIRIEWPEDADHVADTGKMLAPLSFRDQAAIAAMQAFITRVGPGEGTLYEPLNASKPDHVEIVVTAAWILADALDAERERREKGATNETR